MRALAEGKGEVGRNASLDIYVDLLKQPLAYESLLQEFNEIDWAARFNHVNLRINGPDVPKRVFPAHLTLEQTAFTAAASEGSVLIDWLDNGDSQYLATLTGDGEYNLRDVSFGVDFFRQGTFGIVYGARTQSARQFSTPSPTAYGKVTRIYTATRLASFVTTALFSLRFHVILKDPLTGFRIYRRGRLGAFANRLRQFPPKSAASITRLLVQSSIEIVEIPVGYRTYTCSKQPFWRFLNELRNLLGIA